MRLFSSRPVVIIIAVLVIAGFIGAAFLTFIPNSGGPTINARDLWESQSDEVRSEVCRNWRGDPGGYVELMREQWVGTGMIDPTTFDELIAVIAVDCRASY